MGGTIVVESLQKLREPAVVVLLLALLARLVLSVLALAGWLNGPGSSDEQAVALVTVSVTDPLTVVVLVLLVGSCLLHSPSPHAHILARLALALVAAGLLVYVGAGISWLVAWSVPGRGYQVVQLLLGLLLPLLGLLALVALNRSGARAVPAGRHSLASAPAEEEQPALPVRRPDPDREPTWQPDEASGAVGWPAGDAAAGAAAATWGTPGDAGGWTRSSGPTSPGATAEPETKAVQPQTQADPESEGRPSGW